MRHKISRCTALAVVSALIIMALPTAAGATPPSEPKGQLKRPNIDGSIPARWDLPKPPVEEHSDTAPDPAGGNGDGKNNLSFSAFDNGDMVVALGTAFGHAGCFDRARYYSKDSLCVWSANKTPVSEVQLERPRKYNDYDYAYGIWVPAKYTYGPSVVTYCAAQKGEPYNINSSKSNTSEWYCSKLPWKGWQVRTGLDIDADGGYWVWPVDLVNSTHTKVFVSAS
jgi:hypothetical protein